MRVLAIDPGRAKCGVAVVRQGPVVEHRSVVAKSEIIEAVRKLATEYRPDRVLIGGGTGGADVSRLIRGASLGLEIETVDERFTSELARERYFREHPPRGLRRLIPLSLQVPPEPIDDYAAILLAEEYLAGKSAE